MAGTPIRGRDYSAYETRVAQTGTTPLKTPYTVDQDIPVPKGATNGGYTGKQSLFNRYYTFFYSGEYGYNGSQNVNYFLDDSGWNFDEVKRNPTASKLIQWSRNSKNAIEYSWEDFLYCKNYGKVPNNHMVTVRRFGGPIGDNLINYEQTTTPDIGRLITYMDGEANKIEELLKFKVKLNWKEFKSEIQTYQGSGYGGSGGGSLIGKILGATDTAGSQTAAKGVDNANVDPYSNMTNKTLGPINVIDKMMTRERGLMFEQSIKLVFEYEMRSIDGINGKMAFLDLLMNILMVTYNRGDFWGGAKRFVGGARKSNPIAGQDGMQKLAEGDFGGFLDKLTSGFMDRVDTLTGGKGLSLEGLGNMVKSVGANIGSRVAGGAMDKMGRPQAHATMALLTGEDTGEWHITVGNPARPILSLGNMILEETEIQFDGPLDTNDFPTKLKATCSFKPARPRDRDDVQMMFAPGNMERLYSSALDYIKTKYAGQMGPNFGGDSGTLSANQGIQMTMAQNPRATFSEADANKAQVDDAAFADILANRFPNHAGKTKEGKTGPILNQRKWTT